MALILGHDFYIRRSELFYPTENVLRIIGLTEIINQFAINRIARRDNHKMLHLIHKVKISYESTQVIEPKEDCPRNARIELPPTKESLKKTAELEKD